MFLRVQTKADPSFINLKDRMDGVHSDSGGLGGFLPDAVRTIAEAPSLGSLKDRVTSLPLIKHSLTAGNVVRSDQQEQLYKFMPGVGYGCATAVDLMADIKVRVARAANYQYNAIGPEKVKRPQRCFDVLRGAGASGRYPGARNRTLRRVYNQVLKDSLKSGTGFGGGTETSHGVINPKAFKNPKLFSIFFGADGVGFSNRLHKDDVAELTVRNKVSRWASKIAFHFNSLTEFAAAPTGFLLSCSRQLFYPSQDDRKLLVGFKSLLCLGGIAVALSLLGLGLFAKGIGKVVSFVVDAFLVQAVRIVASYSAIGMVTSAVSLGLVGLSTWARKNQELPESCQVYLQANFLEALHRIAALLIEVKHDQQLEYFLCKALKNKGAFGKAYSQSEKRTIQTCKDQEKSYEIPAFLVTLMQHLDHHYDSKTGDFISSSDALVADISEVLGRYLLCQNLEGVPDYKAQPSNKQLYRHDQDVQALFGMVEHFSIRKFDDDEKDLRQITEREVGKARDKFLHSVANVCDKLKLNYFSDKARLAACHEARVGQEERERAARPNSRYAFRNISDNLHQHHIITRCFANMAYALDEINKSVILSLNGLVARFTAWNIRHLSGQLLSKDIAILPAFYAGRHVSSAAWAVFDALFFIPWAAKQDLGFNSDLDSHSGSGPFPLTVAQTGAFLLAISVISTSFQMILLLSLILPLRALASASAFVADRAFGYEYDDDPYAGERARVVFRDNHCQRAPNPYLVVKNV